MKLHAAERRLARDIVGLDLLDCCPVVLVDGPRSPRLVGFEGHYIDSVGVRIMTVEGMQRAGPRGRRYVVATRAVEVGTAWLFGYRSGWGQYGEGAHR